MALQTLFGQRVELTEYTKLVCALKGLVPVYVSQRGLDELCPGLFEPRDLDEPSLIKRRDVPGVY